MSVTRDELAKAGIKLGDIESARLTHADLRTLTTDEIRERISQAKGTNK